MIVMRTEKCIQIRPTASSSNVVPGFRRYVKICGHLGCYAVWTGDSVPGFGNDKLSQNVGTRSPGHAA